MDKRRVILATWYPADPARPRGGVEAVSVVLAAALAQRGDFDVHVATFDSTINAPRETIQNAVTVHRLPRGNQSLLPFATGAGRRQIEQLIVRLQPDVVHAHDTYGIMTRRLRLPRVFTIHGFIHEDTRYRGGLNAQLRAWLWKRVEEQTWAEQPNVVSISPYVRERLRGIAQGTIHDIENPIAPECFEVSRTDVRPQIFSAAVINPRKNTLGLIEGFARARLPGWRLRLAGPITDEAYGQAVKAAIARLGLESSIDLLGSVPTNAIREELSRASVFALVSLEEGAPMGVAEALAAGVPVVTSNRCGMPYMMRDGESGFLVDPLNVDSVARALGRIAGDTALCGTLSRNARIHAENCFHPVRVAERTARVYHDAIQAAVGARPLPRAA